MGAREIPLPTAVVTNPALYSSLLCWALNGLLLGIVWFAAFRLIASRSATDTAWAPLFAAAGVALGGYAVFWLYFASPTLGKAGSVALVGAAACMVFRRRKSAVANDEATHARTCIVLVVAIAVFYLAILHLYPSSLHFFDLAANRLREQLPADNRISRDIATTLYDGRPLRSLDWEWRVSDRPPLQAGWQLITLPLRSVLPLPETSFTGTSALWFQLLWVPALYGLLIALGMTPRRATAWIVVMALSGFFVQNTIFTWPKLSAGAFGLATFALWVLTGEKRAYVLGGALAALGWLSHGGIAFSYLALAPWIVWRMTRGEVRGWLMAAAAFLALALPWLAFQKLYDPPGDRLAKMHLAGQTAPDAGSVLTVIQRAYAAIPGREIVANKAANFRILAMGTWSAMFDFSAKEGGLRRNDEFFCTFRALTWWLSAVLVAPVMLVLSGTRHRLAGIGRAYTALAIWVAVTLVIWCLLMFGPYTTCIHQGSYAVMLGLFCVFSSVLEKLHPWAVVIVALLQAATFVTTWAGPNNVIHGPATGEYCVALAAAGLIVVFVWSLLPARGDPTPRAASPSVMVAR